MCCFCKNSGQDCTVKIIFRTENLGLGEEFFLTIVVPSNLQYVLKRVRIGEIIGDYSLLD